MSCCEGFGYRLMSARGRTSGYVVTRNPEHPVWRFWIWLSFGFRGSSFAIPGSWSPGIPNTLRPVFGVRVLALGVWGRVLVFVVWCLLMGVWCLGLEVCGFGISGAGIDIEGER